MALKIRRTVAADQDLDEIWIYIAVDSDAAADRLVDRIVAAEDRLAEFPNLGRLRPDLAEDVRSWAVGDYVILYRLTADEILVARILHGARDLGALFAADTP